MASALTPATDSEPINLEIDTTVHHLPLYKYCFENMESIGRSQDTDTTFPGYNTCIINSAQGSMTYGMAETSIEMAGTGLSTLLGVSQGDVVMLVLPNSECFVFAFLGLAYLGAVSAMGNPLDDPAEVQRKARAAGAKVVITTASYVEKVRLLAEEDGVRVVCVEEDNGPPPEFTNRQDGTTVPALFWYGDILSIDLITFLSRPQDIPIRPDDCVAITYSSSGSPTTITHRDMIASVAQYADGGRDNPNLYFHTDDVVLCALPLFEMYSLVSVLCGIRVGAAIVILPKLGITPMLKLVQQHKVTVAPLVPDIVVAMSKSPVVDAFDLSSVRTVLLGEAAPTEEEELQETMRALLPSARIGQAFDGMIGAGSITISLADFANDPFEIEMEKLHINESDGISIEGDEILENSLEIPEESNSVIEIPPISLDELKRLTDDFGPKALVGKGPYGQIYQATLSSGQQVAIWVLEYLSEIISEISEFYEDGVVYAKHISILSRLKHDSWADVLGYCLEADTPILVYPFPTHGSLAEALHGKEDAAQEDDAESRPVLTWAQRVKIAGGVARGLEYLHEKADPPVVHGEFGTRNVLLFDDYVPKIASAFTLTSTELNKAFPDIDIGVFGYHAPEYVNSGELTSKSDVYSFGLLLLELITGLKAIDPSRPQGEERLVIWAAPMLTEDLLMQCVDPKLNGEFPLKGLAKMAAIADLCLQDEAVFRPNMTIVSRALQPLLNH